VTSATAEPIVRQSLVINYKMLLVHVGTILRQRVPGNDNVIRSAHVKKVPVCYFMHISGLLALSLRRRAGVVFIHRPFRPALAYLFTIGSQLRYCKHGDVMFDVVVRTVECFCCEIIILTPMHKSTELRKLIVSTNGRVSVVPRVYETSMTDRENRESTSDHSIADKTTGRPSNSRRESQTNRVTIESVRETIGTRQASLLERRTLPQITKQVERKLISLLCFAKYKYR